jgi:site-specific DNA-methyltransferase (adenine-specific)
MSARVTHHDTGVLEEIDGAVAAQLRREPGVALLAPVDVEDALELAIALRLRPRVTMLDPWYNKGIGGTRDDYVPYICRLLELASKVSEHVFLWGFPEIVSAFVERAPADLGLVAWLTWYYKNNPSVIRGWRSSQMACLHFAREDHALHPEHFLNEAQLQKKAEGKLRYLPGPTSVIEAPLEIGFVGRKEQTGHKAQKPKAVYRPLIEMTTLPGDLVFDPMAGSGTTGAVAVDIGRRAVVSDHSEEYTQIMEGRLGVARIELPDAVRGRAAPVDSTVARSAAAVGGG